MKADKVMGIAMVALLIVTIVVVILAFQTVNQPTHMTGSSEAVFRNVSIYMNHAKGSDHGTIMMFSLSTCPYCKQAKTLFDTLGVDYYWVDVDQASPDALVTIFGPGGIAIACNNPGGFPVTIANDKCIVGYDEARLLAAAGK